MNTPKDLLTIDALSDADIHSILKGAAEMKQVFCSGKTHPALAGKSVLTLFYEPSTRTRSSFELAARRLQADVTTFTVATSSVVKGESVHDTIDTLMSMHMDYIIVRHKSSGIPAVIGRHAKASVINAGDGAHAHPSQAFLDAFTLQEKYGDLAGKRVVIIGDILHSRVARSTSTILKRLGAQVAYMGPGPLVPQEKFTGIPRFTNWDQVFTWKPDVIYLLRVQNALYQIFLLVDQGGSQLRGVDLTGGHGHKLMAGSGEGLLHQLFGVVDQAHGGNGEHTQMGPYQQRLGIGVGNAADTTVAGELVQIIFKFGTEGGVLDIMDLPLEALDTVIEGHAAPAGTQVRVIIRSEKYVVLTVFAGNRPEKSTHVEILLGKSGNRDGMVSPSLIS